MSSDQQYPYGPQDSYGPQDPFGPQDPYGQRNHQDPNVTQTWEGQTWDTQYQPTVEPVAEPVQHAPYHPGATDTTYLPPQDPSARAYALPPEVPVAPGSPAAPAAASAAYEPGIAGQGIAGHGAASAPPAAGEPQAAGEPAYSAPTTLGNARITDAQRARAEGRSPIIPPGMQPAGLTAVIGLLLAATAGASPYLLLIPLIALQGLTAAGWFRLNGMWPARQGIALAFAGGLAADAVLLATGSGHAPAVIIGTLGVWVLLTVVLQLRSHASADERMYGLMATVASAALTIVAAGYLAVAPEAVAVAGASVAAAVLARALPLPGAASVVVALLAAAGAGIAAGGATGVGSQGALLGLGAGVCALVGLRVASYDYPSRFVHMTAGVALPLTAAVPAVYLLGRALI
ncbi:hypothetical protein [Streptomyces sp. NBC_00259]|uniref:hypothetical protein n=1 Tax=Streptomyces sp. NBC_00259 TaxID=2903643 RepID=UPI002E2DCD0C|nr:hypothetical protein [Streptomyces sp. NBC_00259]